MRLPVEKRQHIEQIEEISGFLFQSHISDKNLRRLELLTTSSDLVVAAMA